MEKNILEVIKKKKKLIPNFILHISCYILNYFVHLIVLLVVGVALVVFVVVVVVVVVVVLLLLLLLLLLLSSFSFSLMFCSL